MSIPSSLSPNPVLEKVHRRRLHSRRRWKTLRFFVLNLIVALLLALEVFHGIVHHFVDLPNTPIRIISILLLVIFVLNALVDLAKYVHLSFSSQFVELTEEQKRLLAAQENEFTTTPPKINNDSRMSSPSSSIRSSPMPIYTTKCVQPSTNPHYYFDSPSSLQNSMSDHDCRTSLSPRSNSYTYYATRRQSPASPMDASGQDSFSSSFDTSLRNRFRMSPGSEISSLKQLEELDAESRRDSRRLGLTEDLSSSSMSYNQSNLYGQRQSDSWSEPMELPNFPYQIACRSPQSVSALLDDDSTDTFHGDEIWLKLGVSQTALEVWIERLRHFLSQTIVSRVSKEMFRLNKQLRRLGLEDMVIGEVSLQTLKQIARTKGQQLPSLNSVIQFLDIGSNHKYVAARIHELGKGGCMSDFNWNGGMDFKSKAWTEHLPTDCAIVMHCLCTYLDARLPPLPKFPDGRTFTIQHSLKIPDKPDLSKDTSMIIYQSKIFPPHFKVIAGHDVLDLPKGRNNMFQAILAFFHLLKMKDCMLDRVSLGKPGINVLWVFGED